MTKGRFRRILTAATVSLIVSAYNISDTANPIFPLYSQQNKSNKTLKRGTSGNQVSNLVIGLDNAGYLSADAVTNIKGSYIYDETVENAIVHFQRDLGIRQDGVYSTKLDEILFSFWRREYTSCRLGKRTLSAKDPKAGPDVDMLIEILNEAGFPPDPTKLRLSEKTDYNENVRKMFEKAGSLRGEEIAGRQHHYYSKDIEKALMAFQAFKGLKPSGELNPATLRALKESYLRLQEKKPTSFDARPVGM